MTNSLPAKIRTLFVLLFLPALAFASLTPRPAWAFSVGEEKEVGEKLLTIVHKEFELFDDPDISQYVNELGKKILLVAGPQFFDYHFFVIKNKEFNAFAAPSGLIFIHSGLIDAMESEEELLGVMAHEVGHVTSRHIADRLSKSAKTNIGAAALVLAGIAMGGGPLSEALITGSMAAGAAMDLKFSRQDEEEADRLAYQWLEAMQVNPQTMLGMLQKMRKVSLYSRGKIPPYLLTHPEPDQRMSYVSDLLLINPPAAAKSLDNFNFLRMKMRIQAVTKEPATLIRSYRDKIAEAAPGNKAAVMYHYGLAQCLLESADYEQARRELALVKAVYPDKTILTTDLGVLAFREGRHQEALAQFQAVQSQAPELLYNTYYLARTYQLLQQPEKALTIYTTLLEAIPDHPRLHYYLGQIKADEGATAVSHYHLGVYYYQTGDMKMARFHLKAALETPGGDEAIRRKAKEMLEKIRELEKAPA